MKSIIVFISFFSLLLSNLCFAETEQDKKIFSTIKKMLNYAVHEKDKEAMANIGVEEITNYLLGAEAKKVTAEQKNAFSELVKENIILRAFPVVREHFKSVDIPLDKPVKKEDQWLVKSSILWGGSERTQFHWVLKDSKDKSLIVDFINSEGKSSMEQNKKRIQEMLSKEGMDKLLQNFGEQIEKLKQKK